MRGVIDCYTQKYHRHYVIKRLAERQGSYVLLSY